MELILDEEYSLHLNPTKENLEKIWAEKPYGWVQKAKKHFKGKKKYTLTVAPYISTYLEKETVEVFADNSDKARYIAHERVRMKYRELGIKIDGISHIGMVKL